MPWLAVPAGNRLEALKGGRAQGASRGSDTADRCELLSVRTA